MKHMNETTKSVRLDYADVFKGIAILLMVIGHCCYGPIITFIYLFHMPAFFFISGYCSKFEKGNFSSFLVKKIFSILVPFFFITFLFISIKALLTLIPGYISPFEYTEFGYWDSVKMLFLNGKVLTQPLGAFWFLPALFFAVIFAKLLVIACRGNIGLVYVLSLIVLIVAFYILSFDYSQYIWIMRAKRVLLVQHYVCLGYVIRNLFIWQKAKEANKPWALLVIFAICTTIASLIAFKDEVMLSIVGNSFPQPLWKTMLGSCAGVIMLLALSVLISRFIPIIKKFFMYLGKASLAIMTFHFLGIKLFSLLLVAFNAFSYESIFVVTPPDGSSWWLRLIYVVIATAFSVGCYEGIRRIPIAQCLFGYDQRWGNYLAKRVDNLVNKVKQAN